MQSYMAYEDALNAVFKPYQTILRVKCVRAA